MDGMNGYPRNRNPSNLSLGNGSAPHEDGRREPNNPMGRGSMTRAERFEDEKKRIIESCFSKVDPNGQLNESYITHIRVQEDAAYPSTPPPPNSAPETKKPRIIIISVRNTGRVRMHKARENTNSSFSIGKTWNLEDLTAVESFGDPNSSSADDARRKQWAGPVGFIVTLAKPYYWQAGTAKEKEFFIGSLIKIYRKYTQGKVPQLIGFGPSEQELIFGGSAPPGGLRAPSSSTRPMSPPALRTPSNDSFPQQSRPPTGSRSASGSDNRQAYQAYHAPSNQPSQQPTPLQSPQPQALGLQPKAGASQERLMRPRPSREQMRPSPSPGLAPGQRLTPQSSRSDLGGGRSISPEESSVSSKTTDNMPIPIPNQSPKRQMNQRPGQAEDNEPRNGVRPTDATNLFMSAVDRFKPPNAANDGKASPASSRRSPFVQNNSSNISVSSKERGTSESQEQQVPERKRPPLMVDKSEGGTSRGSDRTTEQYSTPEQFATPVASPPRSRQESEDTAQTPASKPVEESKFQGKSLRPAPLGLGGRTASDPAAKGPSSSVLEQTTNGAISKQEPVSEPSTASAPETPQEEEVFRPGLGPMIKKKAKGDAADTFRRAANAYNAFKPRAGRAKNLFSANEAKSPNEPDGISAVIPAPSTAKNVASPIDTKVDERISDAQTQDEIPELKVSSPERPNDSPQKPTSIPLQETIAQNEDQLQRPDMNGRTESTESLPAQLRRRKRRSVQHTKYLTMLDIDSNLLEGRGLDFEAALSDFGWGNKVLHEKRLESMEADVRRELSRVEAGSWLGHLEQKDDRVEVVEKLLDKAIAECEEFEGLLTLYGVELSSLNDDVAFIEAQSQGLQVQTANQKLVQNELENLVDTISIRDEQLLPLRRASLEDSRELDAIESSLLLLYKAMNTIDPAIRQNNDAFGAAHKESERMSKSSTTGLGGSELSGMRALQEKRATYSAETDAFLGKLQQFLEMKFQQAMAPASQSRSDGLSGAVDLFEAMRRDLWQYSPLVLFAKEVSKEAWDFMLSRYQFRAQGIYKDQCRERIAYFKQQFRKNTVDDQSILFTSQEKESESMAGTARKLTVKRSQTLAKSFRTASGEKSSSSLDKNRIAKVQPSEAFADALTEMIPLIFREQNFIVDFFHATTLENTDFGDLVATVPPNIRYGPDLRSTKSFEPNRALAKRIADVMEAIYSFWQPDVQEMVNMAVSNDPLQGVGILGIIEGRLLEYEETNQDFLNKTLTQIHEQLCVLFNKFVDAQIKVIDETRVKIKKRKGVIGFMRVWPNFSAAVENMLPVGEGTERLEIRKMVDGAYQRINNSMFESLKTIAKESPGARMPSQVQGVSVQGQAVNDPEDKEALNFHILLIENMYHYMEEVDERPSHVIAEWKRKAAEQMQEHMEAYVNAVIRRPLGKLLDFIESTELLLQNVSPTEISQRPSHSRSVFKKLLSNYDSKEIRRGVDALRKRVEKHFGEADDPAISRKLVGIVLESCQVRYEDAHERLVAIVRDVYESGVELDWGVDEVRNAFRT
ncbi:MAG: hypothetical protein M1820_000402 [Bogoriella megaspora]|nr:MAG: hypothetical protein M1820_000402 [Bogoriella megaspora]